MKTVAGLAAGAMLTVGGCAVLLHFAAVGGWQRFAVAVLTVVAAAAVLNRTGVD